MTSVNFDDIYSRFLGNVQDIDFAQMDISDAYTLMGEYLHKALSHPYIFRLFSDYSISDDVLVFNFEMVNVIGEFPDKEFVLTLLGKAMAYEWVAPQVQSTLLTKQLLSNKEQQFFSQAAHLKQLQDLQDRMYTEIRRLIQDRGYIYNTYLGNV